MNYHHDPDLAAWMVHMVYCPTGRAVKAEEIARRMGISVPDGSGFWQTRRISRTLRQNSTS